MKTPEELAKEIRAKSAELSHLIRYAYTTYQLVVKWPYLRSINGSVPLSPGDGNFYASDMKITRTLNEEY